MQMQSRNTSRWPDIIIAAESQREPFEDVTIITAKSVFVDLALQSAAHIIYNDGHTLTNTKVIAVAQTLIAANKIEVREHVRINNQGITVCLDVPDIEHEDVAWRALDMVARTLDQLDGNHGMVTFSSVVGFTVDEVSL